MDLNWYGCSSCSFRFLLHLLVPTTRTVQHQLG
jgi:hypothetical protein